MVLRLVPSVGQGPTSITMEEEPQIPRPLKSILHHAYSYSIL